MMVREYYRVKESQLLVLRNHLTKSATEWSLNWFPGEVRVAVGDCDAGSSRFTRAAVRILEDHPAAGACVDIGEVGSDQLVLAMLGVPRTPEGGEKRTARYAQWVDAVASEALVRLIETISVRTERSLGADEKLSRNRWRSADTLPATMTVPGSGAVKCAFEIGECRLALYFPGDATNQILQRLGAGKKSQPGEAALARSDEPLKSLTVGLDVRTRETEISCEQLEGLSIGDVVALDHLVREAFEVHAAGGARIGSAYLGRSGDTKAIRTTAIKVEVASYGT